MKLLRMQKKHGNSIFQIAESSRIWHGHPCSVEHMEMLKYHQSSLPTKWRSSNQSGKLKIGWQTQSDVSSGDSVWIFFHCSINKSFNALTTDSNPLVFKMQSNALSLSAITNCGSSNTWRSLICLNEMMIEIQYTKL